MSSINILYKKEEPETIIKKLISEKRNFIVTISGSSNTKIKVGLSTITFAKPPKEFLKGLFLFNLVKQDAKKFAMENEVPIWNNVNYPVKHLNKENATMFKGVPLLATDVKNCYWQTAFNLGIISEKTYQIGLEKGSDFKQVRNASIGNLGKRETFLIYKNGVLVDQYDTVDNSLNPIRELIKNYVAKMFYSIALDLKDNFVGYQTDCVFYKQNDQTVIHDKLLENGYQYRDIYPVYVMPDKVEDTRFWINLGGQWALF